MKLTGWSQGLSVTADATGVIPLAGAAAVRLLADRVGLTDGLARALVRRRFVPAHDRGRALVDVATVLVAGGEAIGDIESLRHQDGLLGPVASPATVWRALDGVTDVDDLLIGKGLNEDRAPLVGWTRSATAAVYEASPTSCPGRDEGPEG